MEQMGSIEDALNAHFRGHSNRNFHEWSEAHFYEDAEGIPLDVTKAWIVRQKRNYVSIGERGALRHLIAGKVDQSFLDEISKISHLQRLELEGPVTAKYLSPILRLRNLTFLSIESPRYIEDFKLLLNLPSLKTLIITDARRMTDLSWLSEAHHLEVIGIEGSTWTDFVIGSLTPLSGLRSLRAFLGVSTRLEDQSLMPFAHCPRLEFLGIARIAPKEEFDALKSKKPDLVCSWFKPETWATV